MAHSSLDFATISAIVAGFAEGEEDLVEGADPVVGAAAAACERALAFCR